MRSVVGSVPRRFLFLLLLYAASLGFLVLSAMSSGAATYSGIVVDAKSGKVLYSHRADATAYPASLTKMMTLYLLFEAIEAGKLNEASRIPVSAHAASMPPTKLGIKPGGSVSVKQAILALVTKSANDIAAAVGEKLAGTESDFAAMMTRKAHDLGMNHTTFRNASGLPNSAQTTTARDMATLGIALREHFPQYYHYFSTRSFTYGRHRMANHNRLLGRVEGMDGIKTGYTRASGFNLVSSVKTGKRSIVAVVMGGRTGKSRNSQMRKLIASYLPRASRGADHVVVARRGPNPFAVAAIKLPETGPAPQYRAEIINTAEQRILTAHNVAVAIPVAAPGRRNGAMTAELDVAAVERQLMKLSGHKLPLPSPAPDGTDSVRTAAVAPVAPEATPVKALGFAPDEDTNTPAAVKAVQEQAPARDGWQIQIGATPSRESALGLLQKARAQAPKLLASVADYTETVEKGNDTLYRARFAGFASKSEAWGACGELKRKKFACLALAN